MEPALIVAIVVGAFSVGQFFQSRIQAQASATQAKANRQQADIAERALRLQEQQVWREEIDARYSYEISMLRHENSTCKDTAEHARNMLEEHKIQLNEARQHLNETRQQLADTKEELRIVRQQYSELLKEINSYRKTSKNDA